MNNAWTIIFRIFRSFWASLVFQALPQKKIEILDRYFPFYQSLSHAHQKDFQSKLQLIFFTKQFIPRGGLREITLEMKVLIGATIAQVTFGWRKVSLLHFDKILVYPDDYYSTIQKVYHRGEVNPKLGIIVFSWKSFVEGLINQTDGVNLGIHEVAHALKLQNKLIQSGEGNFFDPKVWIGYQELAKNEAERMQSIPHSLFRKRAFLDEHEFFAVAIEVFFEKPIEFRQESPELYAVLAELMRQDPAIWIKS
jgi:Mlc titration factor MtfA (ptsG expression regulator)